jgi:RNA polymerase sporulation-specific sigma factor
VTQTLLSKAQTGDSSARERLLQENAGLIWSIVRRFYGRGTEPEDLYQLGCLGFLKAIDGYDPAYGTQFSTYAVPKIAGEIRRFLRDDGAIKVSRTIKEQAAQLRNLRNQLTLELGREPYLSEIAQASGLTVQEIAVIDTAMLPTDSLQRPAGEDGCSLEQLLPGEAIEEKIIESVALGDAISQLEPRQQAVIRMRYFRGMTQDKTAAVMGVSQVQVSRLERRALGRLKEILGEG